MIANLVTASRIVLSAPLFAALTSGAEGARWWALGVLALAGLTDVVDGRIARALNQTSALGAMLDLIADRLLTLTLAVGLIVSGALPGPWAIAALVLLGRDMAVASFGEATGGRVKFPVTHLERAKIALQFAGFGLLIVVPDQLAGRWVLAASAALAAAILVSYARRTTQALRQG